MMVGTEPGGDGFAGGGEAVVDLDPEHDFYDQVGDDEGGDGVRAEDEPGPEEDFAGGGVVEAAHVDEPVAEGEGEERPAGGVEDVGAGPEVFVDGEGEVPEEAGGQGENAGDDEALEATGGGDGWGATGEMRGFFAAL